ncbi:MAG: ABC transporter ATP-binding protein [Planctomycetes bacterium]|nr:ABC transporter ATP-binding protein [Planctomycetota bacterium]
MIRTEQLRFAVGSFALQDVSLHVAPGEYFVLLGPSGSGKTLLVECLCGLNRIAGGRIHIAGADVTELEPRLRRIGYLPQDYALFPHETVAGNVAFGLKHRRLSGEERQQQTRHWTDRVGVTHLADRFPGRLSGGEKQRVALARALAVEPDVLLLDEPVSALDEYTRDTLCRQLHQLQRDTKTTTIHVCHNFAEMLTVADRVGIIDRGRLLQVGTPGEILQRPRNRFVARFVQVGNLLSGRVTGGDDRWLRIVGPGGAEFRAVAPPGGTIPEDLHYIIRPENIALSAGVPQETREGATVLNGAIAEVVDLGPLVRVTVSCGGDLDLLVSLGKREYNGRALRCGDRVHVSIAPEDVHVLED